MPRGDGTGPWGQGAMTGRGLGYCAGYDAPGYAAPGPGLGMARGWGGGGGRGWGRGAGGGGRGMRWNAPQAGWQPGWQAAPVAPPMAAPAVDQQAVLQQQQEYLKAQLARIEQQLSSLSAAEAEGQ